MSEDETIACCICGEPAVHTIQGHYPPFDGGGEPGKYNAVRQADPPNGGYAAWTICSRHLADLDALDGDDRNQHARLPSRREIESGKYDRNRPPGVMRFNCHAYTGTAAYMSRYEPFVRSRSWPDLNDETEAMRRRLRRQVRQLHVPLGQGVLTPHD